MSAEIARHLSIEGHVQGVTFRASTRDRAQDLGVVGWVRNRPDGSVEAHLEGPAPAVEDLIDYCQQGPPAASVDTVEVTPTDPAGHDGFSVRW